MELEKLYRHRFTPGEVDSKRAIWETLCEHFFSRFVRPTDTLIDIGAGYCEFINSIRAARKIAIDMNPDVPRYAAPDVEVRNESCMNVASLPSDTADVVFMSNFLEHLPSKQAVFDTLAEAKRMLKPGGIVMILQPNIRFLPGEYWDYFDHHTPLTERSLTEALTNLDMRMEVVVPRFLPYTTKSRLPQAPFLVRWYLKLPVVWPLFGKQAFVVARKP